MLSVRVLDRMFPSTHDQRGGLKNDVRGGGEADPHVAQEEERGGRWRGQPASEERLIYTWMVENVRELVGGEKLHV